jgi:hypothetical protein
MAFDAVREILFDNPNVGGGYSANAWTNSRPNVPNIGKNWFDNRLYPETSTTAASLADRQNGSGIHFRSHLKGRNQHAPRRVALAQDKRCSRSAMDIFHLSFDTLPIVE